ncbi:DUF5682 family protein [Scleromatobacter humisilvae]|uniref:DUF5682 family protein n=1 Tax=Scleromatobacter humisilvae TaxID=2897159 RepID=A0A9X1YHX9_9BURK|nr:DUF5682 family protein [Scleromatobacter humisilvae]MCK9686231.1 DUF5682 family protein [Scleromatobacter humisilvae]
MSDHDDAVAPPATSAEAPVERRRAPATHFFGIRHHGPGCARSLVRAFDELRPDCVLIEGPPESDDLLALVLDDAMVPPVALLGYCPDEPRLAVYHPFATFSPEWQALRWAAAHGAPARFIDLPLAHELAFEKAAREARQAAAEAAQAAPPVEVEPAAAADVDEAIVPEADEPLEHRDPLTWLARAAGYDDGESWWNHMVEERADGTELFEAIATAMTSLRAELGDRHPTPEAAQREALREAYMRQCVRAAQKEGFERIAVVCGAWHLPALRASVTAKADAALLKGLPKVKVQSTWVPWTYRHLTRASGYGAGIASPGWYEHLWNTHERPGQRAVGWLARVARLMRERDLDCSSAHLIEATRLAETLAALRERPAPGLTELDEASRTVLTLGDDAALHFIRDALVVGDQLGAVPPSVPTVPLQRDLEGLQKRLRLKPEAAQKSLDLDLRGDNDLARSHLLHRLALLDVPWGSVAKVGRSARGTFHEIWTLQWQPEFALRLIEASLWGQTVEQAATARTQARCAEAGSLAELSALVDQALLADLDLAVATATKALEDRAALTGDAAQLLATLPPLANVFRYGNVRQTDAALVSHVLDGLALRAAIGLPVACGGLDDSAAEALRGVVLSAHAAIALRDGEAATHAWRRALGQVAGQVGAHDLLKGVATRLLLDAGEWTNDAAAQAMSLNLSAGAEPAHAAAWLEGFLNRNAVVLLHDATVWSLVDDWLSALSDEHFIRVLPLVRRTFSAFAASELHDLSHKARQKAGPAQAAAPGGTGDDVFGAWDTDRAALPLPLLRTLLGLPAAASNGDAA